MNHICCIFNYPPHYRKNIYQLIDKELTCDFYFGKNVPGALKEMDCSLLKGYKYRFTNYIIKNRIIWQTKTIRLVFKKKYTDFILSVDTACLSEWLIIYIAKLLGKNVFLWTHGWYGNENFVTRLRKKAFYAPCKGLLLYSDYAKQLLIKQGLNSEKLFVIANSLDYDFQKEIRKSLKKTDLYKKHFNNEFPIILFIGRLETKKKLADILQVISLLKADKMKVNGVFVGDGSDKVNLMQIAKKLNIENQIWFYGACFDEVKIAELVYNSDVCLSPGNVGLTSIHSLSYGTPVVTHNNFPNQMPEFEAIKEEENGAFFKENDIQDMTRVVKNWLEKHPYKSSRLMDKCFEIIDTKYNPYYQLDIIKRALNVK